MNFSLNHLASSKADHEQFPAVLSQSVLLPCPFFSFKRNFSFNYHKSLGQPCYTFKLCYGQLVSPQNYMLNLTPSA